MLTAVHDSGANFQIRFNEICILVQIQLKLDFENVENMKLDLYSFLSVFTHGCLVMQRTLYHYFPVRGIKLTLIKLNSTEFERNQIGSCAIFKIRPNLFSC